MPKLTLTILVSVLLMTGTAQAYIGPGAAAGTITTVLGIIASIFMAFVAVLWYPVKRLFKRLKSIVSRPAVPQARSRQAGSVD
jgi:hypothetical protein